MKDNISGKPIRKAWRIRGTHEVLVKHLRLRCRGCDHAVVGGSSAKPPGHYSKRPSQALARGHPELCRHGNEVLETGGFIPPRMDVEDWEHPKESVPTSELLKIVADIHANSGHPSPQALARAVRSTGGSDEAISTALHYRCPVCERNREPKPTATIKLTKEVDFGECVGFDLFQLADIVGTNQSFLNQVDHASNTKWSHL